MEHEPRDARFLGRISCNGMLGIICTLLLLRVNSTLAMVVFLISLCAPVIAFWLESRRDKQLVAMIPPEVRETWNFLKWMLQRRALSQRTHPMLRALLEDIAVIRRRTLDAMESEAWKERAKTPEGKRTKQDVKLTMDHALYDAIFIGRHLFRGKGQREVTFFQRCQNPAFGEHALESISQIRDEVLGLSESAIAASSHSDLRIELTKSRIQSLVDAETEIEEALGPLDLP